MEGIELEEERVSRNTSARRQEHEADASNEGTQSALTRQDTFLASTQSMGSEPGPASYTEMVMHCLTTSGPPQLLLIVLLLAFAFGCTVSVVSTR